MKARSLCLFISFCNDIPFDPELFGEQAKMDKSERFAQMFGSAIGLVKPNMEFRESVLFLNTTPYGLRDGWIRQYQKVVLLNLKP